MQDDEKNSLSTDSGAAQENAARLNLLYEIGRILASTETLKLAAPQLLDAICRHLHFDLGELWFLDKNNKSLKLNSVRHSLSPRLKEFAAESRAFEFSAGEGLPGRVWQRNAPVWIEDLRVENDLARRSIAERAGMRSAFGFPILLGEQFLGAFCFFCENICPHDEALLQMLLAVGGNIGQFIKRERTERRLHESEGNFRAFVQASSQAIWTTDIEGRKLEAFGWWENQTGQTRTESAGAGFLEAVHPADRQPMREVWQTAVESVEFFETECRIVDRNGEYRYFALRGVPVFNADESFRQWIGTLTDIHERKLAEESVRENREVLLLAMSSSRMGAWSRDLANETVYWSAELEEIFGLAAGTFSGSLNGFYDYVDEADKESTARQVQRALDEHRDYIIEFRFRHADGSLRWMEGRGQAVYAPDGMPTKVYGIGIDITERKTAEAERERLLKSERQARELSEQANRAKDEFIALVSHELRSPLNAMLGWTRILQKQKADEETTIRALDVIARNALSQSRLIEDLLDIARLGKGKLRLELLPLELVEIINAAVEIIKPAAESKNISLTQNLDLAANFMTGDGDRLRQVMENLLANAVKFTPAGGSINVGLERADRNAKIVVSDTGQGISADFLPQIFERFVQADPSDTRRHGGLGIGLSLARDLVELHGGTISAQSAGEGEGSTFVVMLPLRPIKPIKEISGKVKNMDSHGKLSGFWILAVDDEADAREIISFMLQINGARVTSANSAVEALEILKSSDGRIPDILLSDISMPFESGYALLEKVRALPREHGGQIPAVALTAFNRPEDREAAFEAGFQKHLGKPVDMDALIDAIVETANVKQI